MTPQEQYHCQTKIRRLSDLDISLRQGRTDWLPSDLLLEAIGLLQQQEERRLQDSPPLFAFVVRHGVVSETEIVKSQEVPLPFRMIVIDPDGEPEVRDYYDIEQVPDIEAWTQDTVREG